METETKSANQPSHLAAVLAKMGRKAEARDEVRAALRLDRRFDSRSEAEALSRTLP